MQICCKGAGSDSFLYLAYYLNICIFVKCVSTYNAKENKV